MLAAELALLAHMHVHSSPLLLLLPLLLPWPKPCRRDLHLVLVSPQIPQNAGNVARTCAAVNVGLHLVGPMGFELDSKKLKRAGLDYWPAGAAAGCSGCCSC